jgi:Ca-activated chloride channel family protein
MESRMRMLVATACSFILAWPAIEVAAQQKQDPRLVFRTRVERVTLAATVRDRRGRPVTTLSATDFTLIDNGQPRQILEFQRESAPMSLAILADFSGSMDVADKQTSAREFTRLLVNSLTPGVDRAGLYAFDQELLEVQALAPAPGKIVEKMATLEPWGRTRLFDAIAQTGDLLAKTGSARRAVVVLTDGYDNASALTAPEVSGIASSIDVPVYVVVIVSPLDRVSRTKTLIDPALLNHKTGALGDLARWTGGEILVPVSSEETSEVATQIVSELRQQYLIGFEPSSQPGWHPLQLRTKRTDLVVRARSGYVVPGGPTVIHHQ